MLIFIGLSFGRSHIQMQNSLYFVVYYLLINQYDATCFVELLVQMFRANKNIFANPLLF